MTHLQPNGARVLLTVLNPDILADRTPGGIILADISIDRQRYMQYEVCAVGPDCDPQLQPGQRVAVRRFAGDAFERDRTLYRMAWDRDVVAIIA